MSLTNIESSSKPFYRYQRQFVLCESCFWSATSLYSVFKETQNSEPKSPDNLDQVCPMCKKNSVVLIPLREDEGYRISLGDKRGLEIQFSLIKPTKD
jgi:hypothetical protein